MVLDIQRAQFSAMRTLVLAVLVSAVSPFEYVDPLAAVGAGHPAYRFMLAEANDAALKIALGDDPREGNFNFLTYTMGVLVDPCKGLQSDCCVNKFGEPEYLRKVPQQDMGWVWGISKLTRLPYKCKKPCNGEWVLVNETSKLHKYEFDVIDTDENTVWAINMEEEKLFWRGLDGTTPWKYVAGKFSSLTTSGLAYLFAIVKESSPRTILACHKPCTGQWAKPTDEVGHPNGGKSWSGPALNTSSENDYAQVDSDSTHVYVRTRGGLLFSRQILLPKRETLEWRDVLLDSSGPELGYWNNLSGNRRFTFFTASVATNVIWAITETAIFFCRKNISPCTDKTWLQIDAPITPNALSAVEADMTFLWVITKSGAIFIRLLEDLSLHWMQLPRAIDGGFLYAAPSSKEVLQRDFTAYTVEEFSRECGAYSTSDLCEAKSEEGCIWEEFQKRCEKSVPTKASRLPNKHLTFQDDSCILAESFGELQPGYSIVRKTETSEPLLVQDHECVDLGVRSAYPKTRPPCWDNNETVVATNSCTDVDGNVHPTCIAIAFTSTAYISRCGGTLENDEDCGSFLELHFQGNETAINAIRIPASSRFTSGYNTHFLPLNFKSDASKVVCYGKFEIWWVQRSKKYRIVEYIKPFFVAEPLCQWNADNQSYEGFALL